MRDYQFKETKIVMQELIEDVTCRLRERKQLARTIHFHLDILKVEEYINNTR